MAYIDRIHQIDGLLISESILTTAAGTTTAVGERKMISVSISGQAYIAFGTSSGMTAAAATDYLLPAAGLYTMQMPEGKTYLSLYNPTGATILTAVHSLSNA